MASLFPLNTHAQQFPWMSLFPHELRATTDGTRDTYSMERESQFCMEGKDMNFNILETQGHHSLGAAADAMQIHVPAKPTVNRTLSFMCYGDSSFLSHTCPCFPA